MKEIFNKIFTEYENERLNNNFKDNYMANYLKNEAPEKLAKSAYLAEDNFLVKGSAGQGRWTYTPWIAVLNKNITTTPQKGIYIVYLFSRDMSKCYLSLNQGYTKYKDLFGAGNGKEKMKLTSSFLRNKINSNISNFSNLNIELNTTTDNARGYEVGNICAKKYSSKDFPEEKKLINDLNDLIGIYNELTGIIDNDYESFFEKYSRDKFSFIDEDNDPDMAEVNSTPPEETAKREDKPIEKDDDNKQNSSKQQKRRNQVSSNALFDANYCCEYDKSHKFFKSKKTEENYVEAHHLIPLSKSNDYEYSIDIEANIISLCPLCHKKLHHAEFSEKESTLKKLYDDRKERLKQCELELEFNELVKYYK